MSTLDALLQNNGRFADTFDSKAPPMPPARRVAVVDVLPFTDVDAETAA